MTLSGLDFVLPNVAFNGCWEWNVEPFFGSWEKTLLNLGVDGRLKLLNIGGGGCGRSKLLNAGGGGGGSCGNVGGIKFLNVGGEKLAMLLLLLKIVYFLKASSHFILPSIGLVLVPFQQGHSQCLFCQYQVLSAKSWRQGFVYQMF